MVKIPGKKSSGFKLFACNCENSMVIDAKRLAGDLELPDKPKIYEHLCRSQLAGFEAEIAAKSDRKIVVTCTQEAPLFGELAGNAGSDRELSFVNIRENAGWSKSGANSGVRTTAKIAALIAEAALEITPTGLIPVSSNGACIVYGSGQQALDVAVKLSTRLSISLVLNNPDDVFVPLLTQFPIYRGEMSRVSGSIGKFEIIMDNYAAAKPSSKRQLEFASGQNGVVVGSDLIFDMSGGAPMVGGNHGRDGYVHIEPQNPAKIAEAMFDVVDLVGEFEKPIFVSYDKTICAHSRSGQTGCSNCIDNCPTNAITSNGDGVLVNNEICDGCGHCSSSCPTGAIAYAFPNREDLVTRCQTLVSTYLNKGGKNPVLFVHEAEHGGKLISAMARFGDGLAENVLPFSVHSITHIGHDALAAFFTTGVHSVIVLAPVKKRDELDALNFQVELTNTFLQAMKFDEGVGVQLLCEDDPDIVNEILTKTPNIKMPAPKNFAVSKNKRDTAHLALANLNTMAPEPLKQLKLPQNSPYGEIEIDADKCTLCLACVGACPAGVLSDNEQRPQVSFVEQGCFQCGLCRSTCPENAISLKPRYNFDKSALVPVVLNADEPLECTECGKPFGSRSAIEKVISILAGKNPMFQTSEQLALLKMCENCRVTSVVANQDDPMRHGKVPRVRTTEDYFDKDEPTKH